jgi:hypothetical protein
MSNLDCVEVAVLVRVRLLVNKAHLLDRLVRQAEALVQLVLVVLALVAPTPVVLALVLVKLAVPSARVLATDRLVQLALIIRPVAFLAQPCPAVLEVVLDQVWQLQAMVLRMCRFLLIKKKTIKVIIRYSSLLLLCLLIVTGHLRWVVLDYGCQESYVWYMFGKYLGTASSRLSTRT